ncbi:sulfite exporter TauE/SafE family protein [Methylophaga sp. OBS4]|uniref:sulfite exporter TauE/SafE family protein n=1 Tax=Methylophaga sp. OBS4 TaxID=2991935 RepID=UPI0022506C7D|nr:sulfite exporter TauE/SafE family protein [Methylophaga sp. OBS4]MCX4187726.1 sulfite exporter TauE/SafE family protein [Methylophaga sp. OBS4]MCX4187755.1 sulfite exporter TauE/SafE family protein [Methylophaga sp. OBS4]
MIEWLSYAAAGTIAGLVAGLFGVGGGLVIVPVLMLVFSWQGMSADAVIHVAIGTSLMTICITSLSSMYAHHRYRMIDWFLVKRLAPGLMIGSLSGAVIAANLPSQWLQKVFALFALVMAARMWLPQPHSVSGKLLRIPIISSYGLVSGVVSAMVGIGGGTLVVPYLLMAGQAVQRAIGTAAACGFPIAISGVIGFILMGAYVHQIEADWQTGFVHWQAFAGIIATSIFCAPLGARLAKHLPARHLSQLFSMLLLVVGLLLLTR